MSARPAAYAVASTLTLCVLVSGCAATSASDAVPRTGVAAPAATSATAAPAPVPKPKPSAVRSTPPRREVSRKRTEADLNMALLSTKEVPTGFAVSASSPGTVGAEVSSYRRSCAALVTLLNDDRLSGSRVEADVAYAGARTGAVLQESVDVLKSSAAARSVVDGYRAALRGCSEVSLSMGPAGSTPVTVERVSFRGGDRTEAARFTVTRGPMTGFQLIRAVSQSGDLVVGTSYLGVHTDTARTVTARAVRKVETSLGQASRT
ncbi:MAG: hypothetical protein JWP61_1030 [Friedmanniella sp.]|nr:hypothetical protein [Friedmanniella sp.]